MKNSLKAISLLLLFNLSALAANETEMTSREGRHALTLNNRTQYDIAYMLQTPFIDGFYGIRAGKSDIYHSGRGDGYATILTGVCQSMTYNGSACKTIDGETLRNCVGGVYYNANKIKEININGLRSCSVTCVDGGNTSCRVN